VLRATSALTVGADEAGDEEELRTDVEDDRAPWLTARHANVGGILLPTLVGVVALLLAAVFAYVTFRDAVPAEAGSESDAAAEAVVSTERFVSREGGFSVQVPEDMKASREGSSARFVSADNDLVTVVGRGEQGPLKQASRRFLKTLEGQYQRFRLLGTKPERVDGRRALTSYGRATNSADVRIRFVAVVVRAAPRNYTIAAFTAFDSDPAVVLPRVNAIVNGFHVLPRRGR
jgi:hypothetical protein